MRPSRSCRITTYFIGQERADGFPVRVLILNTDYEAFLDDLYAENPGLAEQSYDRQMAVRNRSLFGAADFYSDGLKANGVEAADIHLNNRAMQLRWAAEHGVMFTPTGRLSRGRRRKSAAVVPRKKRAAPSARRDAGLDAERHDRTDRGIPPRRDPESGHAFHRCQSLRSLVGKRCLLVGQIAAPWHEPADDLAYDLIVTSLPNFVQQFERRGIKTFYNQLGFAPSVLANVPAAERDLAVTFVGTLVLASCRAHSPVRIPRRTDRLNVWGMGIDEVSERFADTRLLSRAGLGARDVCDLSPLANRHQPAHRHCRRFRQQHAPLRSDGLRRDAGDRSQGQFAGVV